MKESIKESAFERRQELPAGTVAAPLCQPLKSGVAYRDVTATLKMKRSRRFRGERRSFLAVAVVFPLRRRREEGVCSHIISPSLNEGTISNAEVASDSVSPHLLGLVYIFIGFANKNIGKRIMFCRSQYVLINTSRNGTPVLLIY